MSPSFQFDPAWPRELPELTLPLFLLLAALLTGLTFWTYLGVPRSGWRRVGTLLALRLAALALAFLALARPSHASRDEQRERSTLLILLDVSESMATRDEFNSQSRWDAMRRTLARGEPALQQLRDEQNVDVHIYSFAERLRPFDPKGSADGKRTDYATALRELYGKHGARGPYLGLLLCSDGLDNGNTEKTTMEAQKWAADCPLVTFVVGSDQTATEQRDIDLVSITAEPSPVAIKNPLEVRGLVDVRGYNRPRVNVQLRVRQDVAEQGDKVIVEEKKVAEEPVRLEKPKDNPIKLATTAPDKPGEILVTLEVDPADADDIPVNNVKSTYVTVTKEGLSVLYVDRLRPGEPRAIRAALHDSRINLTTLYRQEGPLSPAEEELFKFAKQHFDVIIIGDLSFQRLSGGNLDVAKRLYEQVGTKGTGLMFLGGYQSFGNSDWQNVSWKDDATGVEHRLAELFPVELNVKDQDEGLVPMTPTEQGLRYYLMRLGEKPGESRPAWERLPKLRGMTKLGEPRRGAVVLATAGDPANGVPLLVTKDFGKGRVLAFGGDTTWRWRNLGLPERAEGIPLHEQFWRQTVRWLAKQEETTGSVWVKPDARRVPAGTELGFLAGATDKEGQPVKDVTFKADVYRLADPKKDGNRITLTKELVRKDVALVRTPEGNDRGVFEQTDPPGEYQLEVRAYLKGQAEPMKETGKVRFLVYKDTAELARLAADPGYLRGLAGSDKQALRLEELPKFLDDLRGQPLATAKAPPKLRPNWNQEGFLMLFLLVFAALLGAEWYLRRSWGLV